MSKSKKGSKGLSGKQNPMYGKGYKISGKKNGMYGRTRFKNPNVTGYKVYYKNSNQFKILTYKECEKEFGIAFSRIHENGGELHYKKKSKNSHYEGMVVEKIQKN